MIKFKEDGSQWYNYFSIRLDTQQEKLRGKGYYFSWRGEKRIAFPEWFETSVDARMWIHQYNWREAVDIEFEKEVLGK